MSQKLSLLARLRFRSSVSKSAFICALSSVRPGQLVSSMSLEASGSNWKAANTTTLRPAAPAFALPGWPTPPAVAPSGECSGPKDTTMRCDCRAGPSSRMRSAPSSLGRDSPSAWR